jgi:hypothetical protein
VLSVELQKIRQKQDEERRRLIELRNLLRSAPGIDKDVNFHLNCLVHLAERLKFQYSNNSGSGCTGYSLHQLQGDKQHGLSRVGHLLKKSEGKVRKVWQKRRCQVQDGYLDICHGDESKAPTRINLLTCQIKLVPEDKRCFDLISCKPSLVTVKQLKPQIRPVSQLLARTNSKKPCHSNNLTWEFLQTTERITSKRKMKLTKERGCRCW